MINIFFSLFSFFGLLAVSACATSKIQSPNKIFLVWGRKFGLAYKKKTFEVQLSMLKMATPT